MSLRKWLTNSRRRLETLPLSTAVVESSWEFVNGGVRRTVGPYIGTSIWDRRDEWDVLCVLDACRTDTLQAVADEYHWLPDEIGSMWSVGSYSGAWVGRTFGQAPDSILNRTGYISGNMYVEREAGWEPDLPIDTDRLAFYDPAWHSAWREVDGVETVSPKVLLDRTVDAWRRREDHGMDRLVVHYMQPHQPFIGYPELDDLHGSPDEDDPGGTGGGSVWKRTRDGDYDADEVGTAYEDNLRAVLDRLEILVDNCDATIVLTADHGNAMGEWGVWGHPDGSLLKSVRKVPWVRIDGRDLCEYTADIEPAERATDESPSVEDRLAELGYVDEV